MSLAVERDQSYIDILKSATNRRQAAKIRDTKSTRTLYLEHTPPGRQYWIRGHPDGVYVYGRGHNGGTHLSRLISPGRLSGIITAATHVDVIEDRRSLPTGVLKMNTGGDSR